MDLGKLKKEWQEVDGLGVFVTSSFLGGGFVLAAAMGLNVVWQEVPPAVACGREGNTYTFRGPDLPAEPVTVVFENIEGVVSESLRGILKDSTAYGDPRILFEINDQQNCAVWQEIPQKPAPMVL
jgi:hypothetical protein